eukprot:TRINITY_DN261_c0_g2_i4.p1 TRINITY_DN261_c0_g2~~TRINITY_DN261_c0_g2_i4.p1  ORF type:complete len:232 (+),score=38.51 TRINITY_DN261_c0_g2_i4:783-1478(+)
MVAPGAPRQPRRTGSALGRLPKTEQKAAARRRAKAHRGLVARQERGTPLQQAEQAKATEWAIEAALGLSSAPAGPPPPAPRPPRHITTAAFAEADWGAPCPAAIDWLGTGKAVAAHWGEASQQMLQAVGEGRGVAGVAAARGVKEGQVWDHLTRALAQGAPLVFMTREGREAVARACLPTAAEAAEMAAVAREGGGLATRRPLKPLVEALGGDPAWYARLKIAGVLAARGI